MNKSKEFTVITDSTNRESHIMSTWDGVGGEVLVTCSKMNADGKRDKVAGTIIRRVEATMNGERVCQVVTERNVLHVPEGSDEDDDDEVLEVPRKKRRHNAATGGTVPAIMLRPRRTNRIVHESDRELLAVPSDCIRTSTCISRIASSFPQLSDTACKEIRAAHGVSFNRHHALASCVRETADGPRAFFGFIWQTAEGKHSRYVCVTAYIGCNDFHLRCTCSTGMVDSCPHTNDVRKHATLCNSSEPYLSNCSTFSSLFGEYINNDTKTFPSVCLSHLTNYGIESKKWKNRSLWVTFDIAENAFVPVVSKKNSMLQCQACRGSSTRRVYCPHEMTSAKYRSKEHYDQVSSEVYNSYDLDELTTYVGYSSRPLLPCFRELENQKRLLQRIRKLQPGEHLTLWDPNPICTGHYHYDGKKKLCSDVDFSGAPYSRNATLFTLLHGNVPARVVEWKCNNCNEWVRYAGSHEAVFPVRRYSLYTTEMLYLMVTAVFQWSFTVRSTSGFLRGLARSESIEEQAQHENRVLNWLHTRRRSTEAFGLFMNTLLDENDSFTATLFKCNTCEVPLTEADRVQLNISDEEYHPSMRRLKGMVIDGTCAGIIGTLPKYKRAAATLNPPNVSVPVTLVSRKGNSQCLKKLVALSRLALRKACAPTFKHPTVSFRPTGCMPPAQVKILSLYLDGTSCFCTHHEGFHTNACKEAMKKADISCESDSIPRILQACFHFSKTRTASDEVSVKKKRKGEVEANGELGYAEDYEEAEGSIDASEDQVDPAPQLSTPPTEETSSMQFSLVRLRSRDVKADVQLLDATLEVFQIHVLEHYGLPYCSPPPIEYAQAGAQSSIFDENGSMSSSHLKLAGPSLLIHAQIAGVLKAIGNSESIAEYKRHTSRLSDTSPLLVNMNPALSRFCVELCRADTNRPLRTKLAKEMAVILHEHGNAAKDLFESQDEHMDSACKEYHKKFGGSVPSPLESVPSSSAATGVCFPGRKMFRELITFSGKERAHCNKVAPNSKKFTPGILTVQCVCKNPIFYGFIVMTKPESSSLALSASLSHFQFSPRVLYYDNACNLFASAMLRVPWLLRQSFVLVDRFHYKQHNCCSAFDANFFSLGDTHSSSNAESINARIGKSLSTIRYTSGAHLVAFLKSKIAMLNLMSMYRKKYGNVDLEDVDLSAFFRELLCDCSCAACLSCPTAYGMHSSPLAEHANEVPHFSNEQAEVVHAEVAHDDLDSAGGGFAEMADYQSESEVSEQNSEGGDL